MIKLFGFKIM